MIDKITLKETEKQYHELTKGKFFKPPKHFFTLYKIIEKLNEVIDHLNKEEK